MERSMKKQILLCIKIQQQPESKRKETRKTEGFYIEE
jgi:hypothetical protein